MAATTTPSTHELVLSERRGGVLVLTLNRPDQLNAWSDELEAQYFALLAAADQDPSVRAIVVTGAGRGFCSGADLKDLSELSEQELPDDAELPARDLPRTFPMTVRKPLIAAINGAAAGLGLIEALYCDLRFTTPDAKLLTAFARRGLIAEYGVAWILPRLVGVSAALDLLLSSRLVQGEEALRLGLVDRVVDGDVVDAAVAYAQELATWSSPTSMATIKAQVYRGLDQTFAEALADADVAMLKSFDQPDVQEGVHSFVQKREPEFQGLGSRA